MVAITFIVCEMRKMSVTSEIRKLDKMTCFVVPKVYISVYTSVLDLGSKILTAACSLKDMLHRFGV